MLSVDLLQFTDSRNLFSNAVGAVCFVAAYNVSKAFSRAAAQADEQLQNDAGHDQDDLRYSQLQSPDLLPEKLWNERMSITREMRDRGQTVRTPPLRLLAQELQGDMPLYMDAQTSTWTWLEPFKLEPETQALLQRMAVSRATKALPSRIPSAPPRDTVLWSRVSGSRAFKRVDDPGASSPSSMFVQLPYGEYFTLPAGLPFFGLGPRSATKNVLTEHGWIRGGTTSTAGHPNVSNVGGNASSGTQNAARHKSFSLPPFAPSLNDSAFTLFPPTDSPTTERRGFFKLTSLSPPPTLPRKRKAAPATADDAGSSKAARTDDAASQPSARSQLSPPPVTPPSTLPRRRSPPGAPRRRMPGPLSPMPTLWSEMRASPITWSSLSPFVTPSDRAEAAFRP